MAAAERGLGAGACAPHRRSPTKLRTRNSLLDDVQDARGGGTLAHLKGILRKAPCKPVVGDVNEDEMQISIDLPEDISASLEERWGNVSRRALEAIAVEGYRTGAVTESQVRRLLGFETRFQVHALLKQHKVPQRYTQADLEDDLIAHRDLGLLPGR